MSKINNNKKDENINTFVREFYIKGSKIILINDNFFNCKKYLESKKIDACITDFPYGTLNKRNQWDKVWNFENFWNIMKSIRKDKTTPTVSTSAQPFTTFLISSNLNDFKYTMVWEKSKASGYLNAKKQPLRAHEDIVVFYENQCKYNPQKTKGKPFDKGCAVRDTLPYGKQTKAIHVKNETGDRYPRSVQYFVTAESEGKFHPTQKPIALYEWLIKTYTNEKEIVLDPCFGSGTTAIGCINTNRNFIGFEKNKDFFDDACKRLEKLI